MRTVCDNGILTLEIADVLSGTKLESGRTVLNDGAVSAGGVLELIGEGCQISVRHHAYTLLDKTWIAQRDKSSPAKIES